MANVNHNEVQLEHDELLALARNDFEAGRLEDALRKLKAVIAHAAPPAEALPLAARVYARLGLMARARDCFEKYVGAHPDALHETFELGMTYFDGGEAAKADELWQRVLNRAPTHPPALFYRALHAAREGRAPDARRHLDVLLQSTPADNLSVGRGQELLQEMQARTPGPN
jgi:tetratricopeptide (TPR) repeat protein